MRRSATSAAVSAREQRGREAYYSRLMKSVKERYIRVEDIDIPITAGV